MNTQVNTMVGLCALGAERILGNEIKHLGLHLVSNEKERATPGQVTFTGDDGDMMRALLMLRTADRLLLEVARCHAQTFDDLFDCVYMVEWQDYFRKDCRVVVDKVRTHFSVLESGRTVQAVVQKAIYAKLGDKWHMATLPETGERHTVRVYIDDNVVRVLLDLSGEPLHKRGYRAAGGIAPLRETTAAVMLHELMWRRKTPLVDPFCGSGTIAIEAALYAHDIAPGLCRVFALESFAGHDAAMMKALRDGCAASIRTDVEVRIVGSDIDDAAVEMARGNAERALAAAGRALQSVGRDERIERPRFIVADAASITAEEAGLRDAGLVLTNPPYGQRLGDEAAAAELYKKMAVMWEHFPQWQFGIITPCKEAQEYFAHYAHKVRGIKAGNLDTTLYIYDKRQERGCSRVPQAGGISKGRRYGHS